MAAATVTSHMATSAVVSSTGGGASASANVNVNGSGDNDVDCFVTTASEELKVIAFNDGMRSVSTSPPPPSSSSPILNCTSSATTLAAVSNVVENMAAGKSLVVLMMDSSTQTEAATMRQTRNLEENDQEQQTEMILQSINENDNDKINDINIENNFNDIKISNENQKENENFVDNENGCDVDVDDEDDNEVCECEYEERIIDYDNFRIIEHIIDTRPLHKNRKKCRELANRVEIIDNRTNSCKIENQDRNDYFTGFTFISDKTSQLSVCDNNDDDEDENDDRDDNERDENVKHMETVNAVNQRVDDNNNNTQRNNICKESVDCSIVRLTKVTEQSLEQLNKASNGNHNENKQIQLDQQQQQQKPFKMRKIKNKQQQQQQQQYRKQTATTTNDIENSFPPMIALKAFQSKLTPLAPPFHPTGNISTTTTTTTTTTSTLTRTTNTEAASSSSSNTSAAVYAYERTTIFYQQQQQQQQQKSFKQQTSSQAYKTHKKSIKQIQHKNYNNNAPKQQRQQQQQVALQTPTTLGAPVLSAPAMGTIYPTLEPGQVFPVQFIPLMSPMPPALSMLIAQQQQQKHLQQQQQQQQGVGHTNAHGNNNDCNKIVQQQQQQQQQQQVSNGNITTMSTADGAWPLVEAPIFIDTNGEYCTYCPAHGTPLMAPPLPIATVPVPGQIRLPRLLGPAQQQQQQHQQQQKHIPIIGVTPSLQQQQQQQQEQIQSTTCNREGHNLLSISSANNSTGTSPSGSPSPTPNSTTVAGAGSVTTAVPLYFKLESGVTTLPLQIAGKSTVLRGKQVNEHNEGDDQDIMYTNVGFYYSPTAVQMVSQNRPTPMPVPVQVGPQGQAVMQPYMNENGTLTHVVLSPQQYQQLHTAQGHIHAPFLTTNGTSHFYSPIPAAFQQGPGPTGAGHTHFHAMTGGHLAAQQPPSAPPPSIQQKQQAQQQQQQQQTQPPPIISHSPSPPNNNYHKDERSQRQHTKLLRKLEKQRDLGSSLPTPANSPSSRRNEINGHQKQHLVRHHNQQQLMLPMPQQHLLNNNHQQNHMKRRNNNAVLRNGVNMNYGQYNAGNALVNAESGVSSVGTSEDGEDTSSMAEDEEDYQSSVVEQLSAIQKPEVCDLTSRSAKIVWEAPTISDTLMINVRDLRFNVLLSDRVKECKYKSLYTGDSYDCIVQDLQPGQEYVVRLQVHYEKFQGIPSEPTEFTTPACEPDQPLPPKLTIRTKNSIHLRWISPNANGAPIQQYLLEYDEGKGHNPNTIQFVELVRTKGKQYTLTKLQPSTIYHFRLAAINDIGTSIYSTICSYSTTGNPPTSPKPPTLQAVSSNSMHLVWERRANDVDFVLQMLDRSTGQGYINLYSGSCTFYECNQLRRASLYQFRLRAQNESGHSPWSTEVSYTTHPERPSRPGKPIAKGKICGFSFKVRWDPPIDCGGAEILQYHLEMTSGAKFQCVYVGIEPEAVCEGLRPGTTYQLRVACEGVMGVSAYSDIAHITSEAIVPAAPPPPFYDNPPGPYAAVLRLNHPDYNGGAPVLEFEVQLRRPPLSEANTEAQLPVSIYRGKEAYCVVNTLQPGHAYEVQVRAWNRIGPGHWSPWFRFAAAAAPPHPPHAPKVIVKSATQLHVSWQAPEANGAPITEYRLESAAGALADQTTAPPGTAFEVCYQGLETQTDVRQLLPYHIYYFRVNASNVAGMSKWSALVHARTQAAVPAAPQIKDYEFTANEVTLRWCEPDSHGAKITAYNIEYSDNVIRTPDACLEYTVSKLQPETAYKFRIQAINEVGAGAYSANAKFTTLPAPPAAPVLECSGVGHNFIKLKWGDGRNLDFTKFYLEMYVQRAKDFQVVYSGSNTMFKVNKLQERTGYTFRICASTDRAGVGDYSEEYTFNTTAALPGNIKAPRIAAVGGSCLMGGHGSGTIPSGMLPETPTSYIAGIGNLSLGVPHMLEWQTAKASFSDAVEYQLQYAIGKDSEFKQIYKGQETKFIIENLEPGGNYQFRVTPIRIMSSGEEVYGQISTVFRYTVPRLPPLDEIDGSMLSSTAACMLNANPMTANSSSGANTCQAHSHTHYHHAHHNYNSHAQHSQAQQQQQHQPLQQQQQQQVQTLPQQHNSRQDQKSVNENGNSNSNSNSLAIGLIPISPEFGVNFSGCDDPHHLHHHHHHHDGMGTTTITTTGRTRRRTGSSSSSSRGSQQTHANLLVATASSLLAQHPLLSLDNHHAHLHQHHSQQQQHQQQQQQHYAGSIRRYVHKMTSMYTNRKRFTDQEKAALFMVSFLFFTFLFATIVKMFIR